MVPVPGANLTQICLQFLHVYVWAYVYYISDIHICNPNSDVSVRARVDKLEDGAAESMASERLALPFKGSGFDNHGVTLAVARKWGITWYYM